MSRLKLKLYKDYLSLGDVILFVRTLEMSYGSRINASYESNVDDYYIVNYDDYTGTLERIVEAFFDGWFAAMETKQRPNGV